MSQDRNERGQFTPSVTLDDVLAVFDIVDGPVVTSGDVADQTGCSRDSARRKLAQLREEGYLESRKTAGRVIYWRTDGAEPSPVNPDDPLFTDRPSFASGRSDLSERVDNLLYGEMDESD
jgi:biotin operon repressor